MSRSRAFLILLLIEFFGLRLHLFKTGFHLDDWFEASLTVSGPGYWDGVRGFADSGIYWDRPGNMLLLPLAHRLSGVSRSEPIPGRPWVAQLLSALLEAAEGWLLFLLLEKLLRRRGPALAAAGLALLFPNRGGFHFRTALLGQHLAHVLMLASMLAHLRWLASGRVPALAAGLGLYALGLLTFDTPMLTPLLLAGACAGRTWAESRDPRRSAGEFARCAAPYAAVFAGLVLWKLVGVPAIAGGTNQKAAMVTFETANAVKVLIAGLGCTTLWPLTLSAVRLRDALLELGWIWLFLPAFASWAAWALGGRGQDEPPPGRGDWGALAGAMAGGFLGSYAPFLLSGSHMPYVNGVLSRVNAAGAWVGGMWTAGLVALLPSRLRTPALALLLAGFTWTNWVESASWARAWDLQKEILSALVPQVRSLPGPAAILLTGAPRNIHGAHVFDSNYDLGGALRLATGRADLSANVLHPNMEIRGDELVQSYSGVAVNRYPLADLKVYDHATRRLGAAGRLVPPPAEKRSVLFKLVFGPGMQP